MFQGESGLEHPPLYHSLIPDRVSSYSNVLKRSVMRYIKLIIPLVVAGLIGMVLHCGLFANLWQEEAARPDFKPRVSLITSLYKGDEFIEQFYGRYG